jgi:hypothetical protein
MDELQLIKHLFTSRSSRKDAQFAPSIRCTIVSIKLSLPIHYLNPNSIKRHWVLPENKLSPWSDFWSTKPVAKNQIKLKSVCLNRNLINQTKSSRLSVWINYNSLCWPAFVQGRLESGKQWLTIGESLLWRQKSARLIGLKLIVESGKSKQIDANKSRSKLLFLVQ